jgi:ACS family hexuronate transporter-like MFS transporter
MTCGPRSRVRWSVAALLFAASVINYIDRQTLSALAPMLKSEFHWTKSDFASLLISFRIAYTIMQAAGGRLFDRLGASRAFPLIVTKRATAQARSRSGNHSATVLAAPGKLGPSP